jgi:hypothetical protein
MNGEQPGDGYHVRPGLAQLVGERVRQPVRVHPFPDARAARPAAEHPTAALAGRPGPHRRPLPS